MHLQPDFLLSVQINHNGVGGLYAELVNDRSFEGYANACGFLNSATNKSITPDLEYVVPTAAWDR